MPQNQNNKKTHLLKRVLHPNRNLFWAISILVVVGFALVAYIYISTINDSNQFVFSTVNTSRHFISKTQHYAAVYPANWQLETDQSGNVIFENPQDANEEITVTTLALEDESMVRNYLNIRGEQDFTYNGYKYSLIKNSSMKDGSPNQVAIIETPWRLYYVVGNSSSFTEFVLKLTFQQ